MEKQKKLVLIEGIITLFVAAILFFAAYDAISETLSYLGSIFFGSSIGFFSVLIQDFVASRRKNKVEKEEIDYEWACLNAN